MKATKQDPWLGLESYTEETAEFFYGRTEESEDLLSRIRRSRLTVLYGQSGLGKSSLLQAGVFPELRREHWLPVYVRLRYERTDKGVPLADLSSQVCQQIAKAIEIAMAVGKITVLQPAEAAVEALAGAVLNGSGASADKSSANNVAVWLPQAGESLWNYLHRRELGLRSLDGKPIAPVLVFDQFEEIFTLGNARAFGGDHDEFLQELADCIENRPPKLRWREGARKHGETAKTTLPVISERSDYRIVLSLREEFLVELLDLKRFMPSIESNHIHLRPLNGWQATDAVKNPAPDLLDLRVAREIVDYVATRQRENVEFGNGEQATPTIDIDEREMRVDPALLSLVCSKLNEQRQKKGLEKITLELVTGLLANGGHRILKGFYGECLRAVSKPARKAMRRCVENNLLSAEGRREPWVLGRIKEKLRESKGVANPTAEIDKLVSKRLMRITRDRGDSLVWLELTHDVLCDVIEDSRDRRQRMKDSRLKRRAEAAKFEEEEKQRLAAIRQLEEQVRLSEAKREEELRKMEERRQKDREKAEALRVKTEAMKKELGTLKAIRRQARVIVFLLVFCLGLAVWAIRRDSQYREIGERTTEEAKEYAERAQSFAKRLNTPGELVGDAGMALWEAAIALRIHDQNPEAVKIACELLMTRPWSIPLSRNLNGIPAHFEGRAMQGPVADGSVVTENSDDWEGPIFAATFDKGNDEVLAIRGDGHLIRLGGRRYEEITDLKSLMDGIKVNKAALRTTVTAAAFSPDSRKIVICWSPENPPADWTSGRLRAAIWRYEDGVIKPMGPPFEMDGTPRQISWSANGNHMLANLWSDNVVTPAVWQIDENVARRLDWPGVKGRKGLGGGDVSDDGTWVATATTNGQIERWPVDGANNLIGDSVRLTGETTKTSRIMSVAIQKSGNLVVAYGFNESAYFWKIPVPDGGKPVVRMPPGQNTQFSRGAFNRGQGNESRFAIGVTRMAVIYEAGADGTKLVTEPLPAEAPFASAVFSGDGSRVIILTGAAWSNYDYIRVWRAEPLPVSQNAKMSFTGKNPPVWLANLARRVAARPIAVDEKDRGNDPEPDFDSGKSFAEEYRPIYERFKDVLH